MPKDYFKVNLLVNESSDMSSLIFSACHLIFAEKKIYFRMSSATILIGNLFARFFFFCFISSICKIFFYFFHFNLRDFLKFLPFQFLVRKLRLLFFFFILLLLNWAILVIFQVI